MIQLEDVQNFKAFHYQDKFTIRCFRKNQTFWFIAEDIYEALGVDNSGDKIETWELTGIGTTTVIDPLDIRRDMELLNTCGLMQMLVVSPNEPSIALVKWLYAFVFPYLDAILSEELD